MHLIEYVVGSKPGQQPSLQPASCQLGVPDHIVCIHAHAIPPSLKQVEISGQCPVVWQCPVDVEAIDEVSCVGCCAETLVVGGVVDEYVDMRFDVKFLILPVFELSGVVLFA